MRRVGDLHRDSRAGYSSLACLPRQLLLRDVNVADERLVGWNRECSAHFQSCSSEAPQSVKLIVPKLGGEHRRIPIDVEVERAHLDFFSVDELVHDHRDDAGFSIRNDHVIHGVLVVTRRPDVGAY